MRWGWMPVLAAVAACGDDGGTGLVLVFEADEIMRTGGDGFDVVIASERDGDDVPIERTRFMLGAGELPHRVGVVPAAGEALPAIVIVRYTDRAGRCAMLDGPDGCTGFECRLPMEAGRAPVHRLRLLGCPADAGPADGGPSDGGGGCIPPSCDDAIPCTVDMCRSGSCDHAAADVLCTDGPDGRCDPTTGCQYSVCTPATCMPGPCQTASCEGAMCVRASACSAGEICCGGSCRAGCDDGNPCTDDSCGGGAGCVNTPNAAACNDGMFCNGADTCAGGSCAGHAGPPCMGMARCDEATDRCTGCVGDGDCGPPTIGAWSGCGGYSDGCDESGTRSRTVTTYRCSGGTCAGTDSMESEACGRDTDGMGCGMTTCTGWSCGGFGSDCDESGTETRTCTDRLCAGGGCSSVMRGESRSCSRDTDGDTCEATQFSSWVCGGFSEFCDETGTDMRTRTEYRCGGGSCNDVDYTETRACGRARDGMTCGAGTTCGACGTCGGFSGVCGEDGTCTRTCTDFTCGGDSCNGTDRMETESCTRSVPVGTSCFDGTPCTVSDECDGMGNCIPGFDCDCSPGGCCIPMCCGHGACF